ncbi:MAG: S9 family peptidase [Pseudomonadota bacterium]
MRSFVFAIASSLAALTTSQSISAQQQLPPPPLEFYGDLPAVEEAEVSPSGKYTALLMTTQGNRMITVLDSAGTPVKQLVVGDAKVRGIHWVGEEAILLLRTETGRLPVQYLEDKIEWWRGNVIPMDDRRDVVSIFANQKSIANAILGFHGIRQVDGKWIGYFGGFRRGRASGNRDVLLDRSPALFAVDLLTGDVEIKAYPGDYPISRRWLVDKNGEVGALLELNLQRGSWKIENANGETIARGQQERGAISLPGFSADGSEVIYSEYDDTSSRRRRYAVPLAGGETREIWSNSGIRSYITQPFTKQILGIEDGRGRIRMEDDEKATVLQEVLDGFSYATSVEVTEFTPDFSALIAKTSGNYDSGTWFRVDGVTGNRSILGLEYPAIQGQAIGAVSTITYEAQDGLEIEGILTLPPGREPKDLPVVVLPHGGPNAHDDAQFDWHAQAFASRGYAVLQPNFRGSTGRGTGFVAAGDGEWGRKMQTDKSDGLMALAERGIVDPDRACIVGASYGGYAALAGVTLQQGIYRCAVSINGVSDLKPLLRFEMTGSRDIFRRSFDKQFGEDTDLDALSPAKLGKRADAPVLLIHGKDDTVVPYSQSVLMQDALQDAGKPVEFVTLKGEDHWLSQPETRKQMLNATVAFVEKHNPPD